MCGIVGVVRRRAQRPVPAVAPLLVALADATAEARSGAAISQAHLVRIAEPLELVDTTLRGVPGVRALLDHPDLRDAITEQVATIDAALDALEGQLDGPAGATFTPA